MARESKQKRDEKRFGKPGRLADKIASYPWLVPNMMTLRSQEDVDQLRACQQSLRDTIASVPIIVADNVCEYLYAESPKENWEITDFPNVAPPFPEFFIEARRPSRYLSGSEVKTGGAFPPSWGWLFRSEAIATLEPKLKDAVSSKHLQTQFARRLKDMEQYVDMVAIERAANAPDPGEAFNQLGMLEKSFIMGMKHLQGIGVDNIPEIPEEIHTVMTGEWISETMDGQHIVGPLATITIMIRKDGSIFIQPHVAPYGDKFLNDESFTQSVINGSYSSIFPMLLALSFMHCKNVMTPVHEPDQAINRKRKNNGLRPFVRYHTINIEPMKKVLRVEGDVETTGLKRALHICRGHFATYTDERPLFGRVVGTIWKPAHARGSFNQGVVVSDYNVNPPKK